MINNPRILTVSTAVPPSRYPQEDILDAFLAIQQVNDRRARAIGTIFERAGVGFRHLIVDDDFFCENKTTQQRNDRYLPEAIALGERTIRQGLDSAGYTPDNIDDLIVVSCTGFSIPGLDLHLAGRLKMRPDLRRTCVLGMGCYGAFPALNRARDVVRADRDRDRLALVLSVELCSLHLQSDVCAESVVSSALFSDGAAMALIGTGLGEVPGANIGPQIIGAATFCDYATLDHMAFTVTDHGFRMILSSYVPDILSSQIAAFVEQLLDDHDLTIAQVRCWAIHPGSTKIVDYVQRELGLTDGQVEASHQVLHEYGNMSSATILFVLERIMRCEQPEPGDYGVLLAFGPGLTIEGLVVRW
jgi:predicted naringenin-chalcone synthase